MATRNVVLTERQEKLIEALVRSGRYQNASEVVREGLRLIERREVEDAARLAALREAAATGIADLDRGAFREFPDPAALATRLISEGLTIMLSVTEGRRRNGSDRPAK